MNRNGNLRKTGLLWLCGLALGIGLGTPAEAGLFRKRAKAAPAPAPVATPTAYAPAPASSAPLGTFYETPYVVVRGNWPTGGGYSPLDMYGDTTAVMYGPLSVFRSTAAPVRTYARGYDGRGVILEGTGFSTPNLPTLSPVVYPTQGTYYFAPRSPVTTTPPWWKNGNMWIDQN